MLLRGIAGAGALLGMMETVDVAVIGLGPAGGAAAAAAAAAGASVVAIDRRAVPGMPVQCAEFVPGLLAPLPDGVTSVQPIARMLSFVASDPPDETPNFPGRMIDRAALDVALAAHAARRGARTRFATVLRAVEPDGTLRLGDGTAIAARVVIGADGPRSRSGAAIGAVNEALVETRQITVTLARPHDATDIFLHPDYTGGYAWLFPKVNTAHLGIGLAAGARARLRPLLAALHAALAARGRVGMDLLAHTGGPIPVGGRIRAVGRLGERGVLLAGDAAGLANPVTGAGIASAVQSGALAGAAAAAFVAGDGQALAAYEDDLAELFDAALNRARRRRVALLAQAPPDAAALRAGWIAYPEYWTA